MNIDMTADYDGLLKSAKGRWAEVKRLNDEARDLFVDGSNPGKYRSAEARFETAWAKYLKWIADNVESRGMVKLVSDFETGEPVGIEAMLAGKDVFSWSYVGKPYRKRKTRGENRPGNDK